MATRRRRCNARKQGTAKQCQDSAIAAASTETTSKCLGKVRKGTTKVSKACTLDQSEVMAAIASLYADELKPFGRILRKRVAERRATADAVTWVPGSEDDLPIVDIIDLLSICNESNLVTVEPEEGGDWSAILMDPFQSFVDVYSPEDTYPSILWEGLEKYLLAQTDENMHLPGGRYSCAQVLRSRDLQCLQGQSLGRVCHIVQLAISKKKLLGYLNGTIVPYRKSQSMLKEQCAIHAQPCIMPNQPNGENDPVMADLETARKFIRTLLETSAEKTDQGVGTVPLSNVKRFLRSRFNVELSETMLGHSKLSDLLQDSKFSDICTVRLQKYGYIVVQVRPDVPTVCKEEKSSSPLRVELHKKEAPRICGFDEPLSLNLDEISSSPKGSRSFMASSLVAQSTNLTNLIQHTFIHAALPRQTTPNARRRSHSLPKDSGSRCNEVGYDWGVAAAQIDQCRSESTESTVDSITEFAVEPSFAAANIATLSSPSPFCCRSHPIFGLTGNSPAIRNARSMGNNYDCIDENQDGPFARTDLSNPVFVDMKSGYQEPLSSMHGSPKHQTSSPTPCKYSFLSAPTCSKESSIGSIGLSRIQNTFIHSPMPSTPLQFGAIRRAHSLPKDLGSTKDNWEATCQALGCGYVEEDWQRETENGYGWGPTPNLYSNPNGLCSLVSSPAVVANSPTLTASPMDCQMRSWNSQKLLLRLATGPYPLIDQTCNQPPAKLRVIHLADFVE